MSAAGPGPLTPLPSPPLGPRVMPSTPSSLSGKGGRVPQTDPDTLGAMDESPSLAGAPHLAGVADSLERGDAAMGEPDDDDETYDPRATRSSARTSGVPSGSRQAQRGAEAAAGPKDKLLPSSRRIQPGKSDKGGYADAALQEKILDRDYIKIEFDTVLEWDEERSKAIAAAP